MTDQQALAELGRGLKRARKLHPQFAENKREALKAIRAEAYELGQAIACKDGIERERAEALDVAVCAMRYYLGEHTPEKSCKRCGKPFSPKSGHQKYCSDECAAFAWMQQNKAGMARRKMKKRDAQHTA